MKKILIPLILISILSLAPFTAFSETIDVQIKGVDDGVKTNKQRDYKEAVLFAKREAIERAGVNIKAITTVKDLVLNSDYIESKAEAVLLPGYNILDMGYSADGTYQIVLIGKVKTVSEGIDSKELRYAKSLMDRGESSKARKIIADIIKNSKDDNVVAETMYYQVVWKFASDQRDIFEKLKAYYPNSKYVSRLESLLDERERKRKEEERKRIEAERKRKAEERKRIEAERKRKAEIERKRKEEERKYIEAELKRQKREEEERKRKAEIERKWKEEEERQRKVERERLEAERKRKVEKFESIWGEGALRKKGHYILYSSGRVLDINTDLEWYLGPDRNTSWYTAKKWVTSLNVDGGGWRMPTREELKSLYQKGTGSRHMTTLLDAKGWCVWSGEIRERTAYRTIWLMEREDSAWYVSFTRYDCKALMNPRKRSSGYRGLAVRSRR
jgi:hypothetical protein